MIDAYSTGSGAFTIEWAISSPQASTSSCDLALDLASLTSPYSGSTSTGSNDYATTCGGNGNEAFFFVDLQPGETLGIQQTYNEFDSRHELSFGDACPGATSVECRDDPDTNQATWTNDEGGIARAWFMIDAYSTGSGAF